MSEISTLKTQTLQIKEKFSKSKEALDVAQLKKKKITTDPQTQYDEILKRKAEEEVISSVQVMENIIPQMKAYSKKLESKKEIFNTHMRDTFELGVMNVFKGIVHINQLFFLLGRQSYDTYAELRSILNNKIIKGIRSNSIDINDFTERKYAKSIEVYYDPVHFGNADNNGENEIDADEINENVFSTADSYVKYIETFLKCITMRRKIVSFLMTFIDDYIKCDTDFVTKLSKIQNKMSKCMKRFNTKNDLIVKISWNKLSSMSHLSEMFHTNLSKYISSRILHITENYKKCSKKEFDNFTSKWSKYTKKISYYKTEYDKARKKGDKKGAGEIEQKLKKYLKDNCKEFIISNVSHIREKEKKRAIEINSGIETIISQFEKSIESNMETANTLIDIVTTSDIFEDVKEIFSKFFEKFSIANSDNYMDIIKVKILTKIDFEKEDIGQNIKKYFYNNNSTILNINQNMNLSLLSHQSFVSSVGNEEQLNIENEIKIPMNKSSSSSDDEESVENIEFVNKENFDVIDQNKLNPYQNFKEKELKRILTKINNEPEGTDEASAFLDDKIKIEKENETLIDKFKCTYKIRLINNPNGYLYLTSYKVIFYNDKNQISVPLSYIVSVSKVNEYIEVKTKKKSFLFFNFEDDSKCIAAITKQITSTNTSQDGDSKPEEGTGKVNNKYSRQLFERTKSISAMLEKIEFFSKLQKINDERYKEFEEHYANDNLLFKPPSEYHICFYDNEFLSNTPASYIYNLLINPETVIDELGKGKGFFESMYINRNDKDIKLIFDKPKEENGVENLEVPKFYSDIDYACNLFTDVKEEDLNELLEEIPKWPKSTTYEIHFIHPLKKMIIGPDRITMKNKYITHFVSPLCFIVDMLSYGSDFPFAETFVSMSQYRFNTVYKFNQNSGLFEFKTSISIYFNIKFIKSCLFEGTVKSEGYKTSEEDVRFFVFENMKSISDSQSSQFQEMFTQLANENLRRSLYKFKGDVNIEEMEEEKKNNEESNSKKEEKEITPTQNSQTKGATQNNDNNGNKENKNQNRNIIILMVCILVYFVLQTLLNKNMGINEKILNVVLIGVIGYFIFQTFKSQNTQ